MKAMVLAAGRGERLRPLTDTLPKPLAPLGEKKRLIDPLLYSLKAAGIKEVVMNVCYLADLIVDYVQDGRRYGIHVVYSRENEGAALETGGGILQALPLLGPQPFLVVSADVVTDFMFASLIQKPLRSLAHLVFVKNPEFHPKGDFHLQPDGCVTFHGNNRLTYANIGVLHPQLFAHCEPGKFPLVNIFREAIAKEQLTGELFHGFWHNVGDLQQLRSASHHYCD